MIRPLLTLLTALSMGASSSLLAGDAPSAKAIDWAGDLAFLRTELPARHKNLFFQVPKPEFERRLAELAASIGNAPDIEVALRLHELVVGLGDDHSAAGWMQVPVAGGPQWIPVIPYWFSDGWRITQAAAAQKSLLGCKLLTIGGRPIEEVEAAASRLVSRREWLVKSRLTGLLSFGHVLAHLGLVHNGAVALRVEDMTGAVREVVVPLESYSNRGRLVNFEPSSPALGYQNQRSIIWWRALEKPRLYYAQYNRCEGREVAERLGDHATAAKLPSLVELFAQLEKSFRLDLAAGKVDGIILDLRHNGGGASDFGTAFAARLATIDALKAPGRVYVIIGRRTFSSAIINAGDFKRMLNAVVVGEPTGGTPNHYGETKSFTLPSSGIPIVYSTKYFGEPGAPLEPMKPDLMAVMSFEDYRTGADRPIRAAIEHHAKVVAPAPTTTAAAAN